MKTDGLEETILKVAHAITADACPGRDESGGYISSLTEAVMGMTSGLHRIAEAIDNLADAVREHREEDTE